MTTRGRGSADQSILALSAFRTLREDEARLPKFGFPDLRAQSIGA
jgi:hypothetical protein